jgi:sugar lactone lactonase YvrE
MDQAFRIADLEVSRAESGDRIVGIFRYDSEGKGRRGPVLLMLADIDSSLYVYEQLLDVLNQAAEEARTSLAKETGDQMARFEKLVQKLNDAVAEFSKTETSVAWNRVNIFLLELADGQVCLTGTGKLFNVFLQKQSDATWRGFDLFGSLEQPPEPDPTKPFSSFLCGDMKPGDLLFAGTQNFEPIRSALRLTETLKSLPPVAAALEIRQELERHAEPDDYAGFVVWIAPLTKEEQAQAEAEGRSTRSVEKMRAHEAQVAGVLSPAIKPPRPAKTLVGLFADMKSRMKPKPRTGPDAVAVAGMRGMAAGHGTLLSVQRKRLLIVGAVLAVFLIIGGIWFQQSQKAKAEQALWNAVYDQAESKKTDAESAQVYDEDRARSALKEATDLANGLDEKTPDRKTAKSKLLGEITGVMTKLKRLVNVDSPSELASASLGAADNALAAVAVYGGNVYAADTSASQLVEVKPDTRETKRYQLPATGGQVVGMWPGQTALYILTSDHKMFSFDPKAGTITAVSWSISKASSTAAFAVYGRRFYVLDTVGNMVWRYSPISGGIGSENPYLKQNTATLANAVGVAVDQNVYIAFNDGSVKRYLSGAEDAWQMGVVDPTPTSYSAIWTNDQSDRIVLADPSGKRLIVITKAGRLVAQIVSPVLKGPNSVQVDPANQKIYATDGNKLYQFDLP